MVVTAGRPLLWRPLLAQSVMDMTNRVQKKKIMKGKKTRKKRRFPQLFVVIFGGAEEKARRHVLPPVRVICFPLLGDCCCRCCHNNMRTSTGKITTMM